MVVVLTGGERHEQPVLPTPMERGAGKWPGRGRPRARPNRVAGDKGYGSPTVRRHPKGRQIGAVIPTKADEVPGPGVDRAAHRARNVAGRPINRLKRWRRIAARYGKRAANHRAMLTVARILLWLRGRAPRPGGGPRGPAAPGDGRVGDGRRSAAGKGGTRP